ncbi:UNVERIFIED_CONTAM: hypothetical protein RMT77_016913 [Armadillidium vulgare]
MEELEARLINRGTETKESLQKRISSAQREMEYGEKPGNFHLVIVNDVLDVAYARLKSFLSEEINRVFQKK